MRRAVEGDQPVAQENRTVTQTLDGRRVVRHEHDRPAALLELEDLAKALALELLVADRKYLVEQQDVRVDVRRDGEAEPHIHARGVRADGPVDRLLEPGERDDLIELFT